MATVKKMHNYSYKKLETQDSEAATPISPSAPSDLEATSEKQSLRPYLPIAFQIGSAVLAVLIGFWLGYSRASLTQRDLILQVSQDSPILKDMDVDYSVVKFKSNFSGKFNIFQQDPGPEVDAAWNSLGGGLGGVQISKELGEKAGLSANHIEINEKYGGGFLANLEGVHHLHCLNLLRQTLIYNYDYYVALGVGVFSSRNETSIHRHTAHCLDILRQQLMCNVDIGVIGYFWTNISTSSPKPPEIRKFPDFNNLHKCRDFEAIKQWEVSREVGSKLPLDYYVPPRLGQALEQLP